MFRIGQKIICVYSAPIPGFVPEMGGLTVGHVYTVRGHGQFDGDGRNGIFLKEITRSMSGPLHREQPFDNARFRPLIERNQSQDMEEHFNHLLSIDLGVTLDILDKHVMEE